MKIYLHEHLTHEYFLSQFTVAIRHTVNVERFAGLQYQNIYVAQQIIKTSQLSKS